MRTKKPPILIPVPAPPSAATPAGALAVARDYPAIDKPPPSDFVPAMLELVAKSYSTIDAADKLIEAGCAVAKDDLMRVFVQRIGRVV